MRLGSRPRMVTIRSFRLAPPPTRFFDLLPPELLRHVIQQIGNLPAHHYKVRQATLYSLCLTSKPLRKIAQPLLLERIYILYSPKIANLAPLVSRNSIESLVKVQSLYLRIHPAGSNFFEKGIEDFVRKATRLRDVYISGAPRAVQILGGTNITTLSLHNVSLGESAGRISFPQLVNLSLHDYERFKVSLSIPKLKHLALIPSTVRSGSFSPEEVLVLDQVAPTLASLTLQLKSLSFVPPSICSSSISLLFRTELYDTVPSSLPRGGSIMVTLPNAEDKYAKFHSASERAKLQDWTNFISTSGHQLEAFYLAIRFRGGGGDKVHPALEDAVNGLVLTSRNQARQVFWVEESGEDDTFADYVPASFIKRSEARYAEAHRT